MKYIKDFGKYKESVQIDFNDQNLSDLLESLAIWEDSLLSSINTNLLFCILWYLYINSLFFILFAILYNKHTMNVCELCK